MHFVNPIKPAWFQAFRVNDDVTAPNRITGGGGQLGDPDPPLQTQPRLDRLTAALRMPDTVKVGTFLGNDPALGSQGLPHLHPGRESIQTVELRCGRGDPAPGVHDREHRQVVSHCDLEVIRIMCRRDFNCAGAEFGVNMFISDNQDLAILEGVLQGFADQMPVTVIGRMHRDRGIAEHGLEASGRHDDVRLGVVEGAVAKRYEFTLNLFVFHLEVRYRGL